jgi:hypothetical protein
MIKPDFAIMEINVKVETLKHPTILFLATLGEQKKNKLATKTKINICHFEK